MKTKYDPEKIFTKEFLSKISHNSRSPFNGLLGFSELFLLNQKRIKPESVNDYLLRINMLAKKAFISSENMVLFLKIYSNNIDPIISSTSFKTILDQSFNLNKEAFEIKKVVFQNNIQNDFTINCDAYLTGSILSNIILKSIKLCDDQSKITISSKEINGKQHISVEYTGMKIESEIVQDYFSSENYDMTKLFSPELDIELWLCINLSVIQGFKFGVTFQYDKNTTSTFLLEA